ncbi:hypothetical protein [Paractinoplanes maris]|uniref:hypothetical protein n=1 Tax=Paractinoplanes maris TaxID=1734446 RepID=UPI0020215639|nr:hypothetical protein [Actinoplanes maris]
MHILKRALLCAAVATTGSIVAVGAAGQPAQAMNYTAATLTAWTWTDSGEPAAVTVNPAGDAPVGTIDGRTHRAYFTYDLTPYQKQALHLANLYSTERSAEDCSRVAPVEVWRTTAVTGKSSWQRPPRELELVRSAPLGPGTCPGAYLGVDVLPQLKAAISRHDKAITFGVRVSAADEGDGALGRTMRRFALSLQSNTVPKVTTRELLKPDRPCGTLTRHPSAGGNNVVFSATAVDPDNGITPQISYAFWPVDHPDQRSEGGNVRDLTGFADGTVLAWAAQADDRDDKSPWSKPCYLTVDNTAPATPAVIHSQQYGVPDYPGSGGPGVAGTFVVDAADNRDIVAYDYDFGDGRLLQQVATGRPGGRAKIGLTPSSRGPGQLRVRPVDAAGNRGPFQVFRFHVRDTAPFATVTVGGVGLPSTITLGSRAADATAFEYAVDDGPAVRLPVVGGAATARIVFATKGTHKLTMRAYAGSKLIGSSTQDVPVKDEPAVGSDEFRWDLTPILGDTGSFRFSPKAAGVVAYRYDFGDGEETVEAAPDGTAVLPWTPPRGGRFSLSVRSVTADGVLSDPTVSSFSVIDTHPGVAVVSEGLPGYDGVGRPVKIELLSELPGVAGFVYSYDGGPEKTVEEGFLSYVEVIATRAGDASFTARAKLADGTLSPATTITVHVSDAPLVTVRGPFSPWPVAGLPATATFEPARPGVVEYRYNWGLGDEDRTLAAGPDGTATLTWTPETAGSVSLHVVSVTGDGAVSTVRDLTVPVDDPAVSVMATWDDWSENGGPGVPGTFSFSTWMTAEFTVAYRWHVDDGPVTTSPADPASWITDVSYTPVRSGSSTLFVQQVFTDGSLSPVTEYPFRVG